MRIKIRTELPNTNTKTGTKFLYQDSVKNPGSTGFRVKRALEIQFQQSSRVKTVIEIQVQRVLESIQR
jgi:hypothetical protein